MNLTSPWSASSKFLFRMAMRFRRMLPKTRSKAFGQLSTKTNPKIDHIYVINLNRQPTRWQDMQRELRHVQDSSGISLLNLTDRYEAIDATQFFQDSSKNLDIDPVYTLADQLFVEPQPLTLPTRMELYSPIRMSRPEIAVASSHVNIWRLIATSNYEHVLILEDDVWLRFGFARDLDQAWTELKSNRIEDNNFDILYLSYEEVKHGAPKTFLSNNIFRPVRGLWHLSGYVVSRQGAEKLLQNLPCRGPVDLWINLQFEFLDVRAIKKTIISQRYDLNSTNSYSILPSLTKIGAITSEGAALFQIHPKERPVFAFGPKDSGLSSLAMALSMLGYTCCSDLHTLPSVELDMLLAGEDNRIFDAYVNIKSLEGKVRILKEQYPNAKFIITSAATGDNLKHIDGLDESDVVTLDLKASNKWQTVCEHLKCSPPTSSFPQLFDNGDRQLLDNAIKKDAMSSHGIPKRDKSPWIIGARKDWKGIECIAKEMASTTIKINDHFPFLDTRSWLLRNDTFTDNLALFRPTNIELMPGGGAALSIKKESLGIRKYSAAALSSNDQYIYGRFDAIIKVSKAPGVITGFFLHRDSPRQEIDIEITGNYTNRLLVNVFYNPGDEGAKFDYGYRGAPSYIDLGFDASESFHQFTIEWEPSEIRWLVDNRLVHRRVVWDPTPIPHLPMSLHLNIWPCRSKEVAGRLNGRKLPTTTFVKTIALEANRHPISQSL